jgi:hypothetical protein
MLASAVEWYLGEETIRSFNFIKKDERHVSLSILEANTPKVGIR